MVTDVTELNIQYSRVQFNEAKYEFHFSGMKIRPTTENN